MTPEALLARLDGVKRGDERQWTARCPAHDDRHASLSIGIGDDGRILLNCHAGCTFDAVVARLGLTVADLFTDKGGGGASSPQQQVNGATLAEYAAAKRLPVEFLTTLGLSDIFLKGVAAIRIPYYDRDGNEIAVRFRKAIAKSDSADQRFSWRKGSKPALYGLWRLKATEYVVVVEGESDCHTLWFHDLPAVGIPGADNWNEARDAMHLEGIATIYVVIEPDAGGEAVKAWLAKSAIRDRAKLLSFAAAKDPSEVHCTDPAGFPAVLASALGAAPAFADVHTAERETKREVAWQACSALATMPDILERFVDAYAACGAVGEARLAKLLYLALTSRFLPRPVSVAVKGPSSGGKSFTVETVLRFFPPEAVYAVTAMSERALAYTDAELKHRFLVLFEAAGMSGEFATYLIRSLLSEGRLVYEVVEKTADGIKPRRIEKEGPTGLLVTTTAVRLHPENETRLLSLTITDTAEQTRAVLHAIAEGPRPDMDPAQWVALQDWLGLAEHRVVVPYARRLAGLIPPVAVRLRRDFGQVLNLVKAHAILHQQSRERDPDGRVIATYADYAVVRELIADYVAEGVEATVSTTVRQTVDAVDRLTGPDDEATSITAVAKDLGLDKSAASRRVATAVHLGYLRNLEDRKGRPARLQVGDPLPDDVTVLPTVEVLQRCSVEGGVKAATPPAEAPDIEEVRL